MIAVVVPSIRPNSLESFKKAWSSVFESHDAVLFAVLDGEKPKVEITFYGTQSGVRMKESFPDSWLDVTFNFTDAVRNLGFLCAVDELGLTTGDYILTLDDDLTPHLHNDPIQEHLDALKGRVPLSWFKVGSHYTRGFPYKVRSEAEVWISVGVWEGVKDWDAPTQLVLGNPDMTFYKGSIPKGCFFPFSGMNVMWKVEATPYLYYAPMGRKLGVERFADIFMGISCKKDTDDLGKAIVTGYSTVYHDRASDPFRNLTEEAKGIRWNETWWKGEGAKSQEEQEYFALYSEKLNAWKNLVKGMLK